MTRELYRNDKRGQQFPGTDFSNTKSYTENLSIRKDVPHLLLSSSFKTFSFALHSNKSTQVYFARDGNPLLIKLKEGLSIRNLEPSLKTKLAHPLSEVWNIWTSFFFKYLSEPLWVSHTTFTTTHYLSSSVIGLVHCTQKENTFVPRNNKDQFYPSSEVLKISPREISCLQVKLKCCPTGDESTLPWGNISTPETEHVYGSLKAEWGTHLKEHCWVKEKDPPKYIMGLLLQFYS